MKHYIFLILLLFLISFISCNSEKSSQQVPKTPEELKHEKQLKEIDDYEQYIGYQERISVYLFSWKTVVFAKEFKSNRSGKMYLEKGIDNNKTFLRYSITTNPIDLTEYHDFSYELAHIYPSKKLYLKLDNGDVLTLSCNVHNDKLIDLKQKRFAIYEDESYFNLTDSQLNKLLSQKIIKMRGDVAEDNGKTNICEYQIFNYQNPKNKFENDNMRIKKEKEHKADLDSDPLKDF